MLQICCKNNNIYKEFPVGSSLLEIYSALDLDFPYQVVSARVNNRSEGLNFRVYNNKDVEFLDVRNPSGMRTYVRSLCFILYKAVSELFPKGKLYVEHPVSKGYFCNLRIGRPIELEDVQAIIDACPYNIPRYDAATKRLTKCDMCIDRVSNGMVPMCVKTCPTGAMTFGERAEVLEKARKRLESVKAEFPKARLIDAEDVNVIYLLAEEPEHYHDFAAFAQR